MENSIDALINDERTLYHRCYREGTNGFFSNNSGDSHSSEADSLLLFIFQPFAKSLRTVSVVSRLIPLGKKENVFSCQESNDFCFSPKSGKKLSADFGGRHNAERLLQLFFRFCQVSMRVAEVHAIV